MSFYFLNFHTHGVEGSTEADHSGNDHMDGIESNSGKQEPVSDSVQLASTSVSRNKHSTILFVYLHGCVCNSCVVFPFIFVCFVF